MTVESASTEKPQDKGARRARRRRSVALALLAVALVAAGLDALLLGTCSPEVALQGQSGQHGLRDPNAELGQYEGKSDEEVRAELDRIVEEGMFDISIASTARFADGTSEGALRIENVPGNRYLMRVSITRDDTGEEVYRSGLIEPGTHIQNTRLDVDLDAGVYGCTARFEACDPETEQPIGEAAAKMTIMVEG